MTAPSGVAAVALEDWDAVLDELGCGDVYLRRDYVESACVVEPGRATLLVARARSGAVVFPVILREVEGTDARDVITPYGYGGPVATGTRPPLDAFWDGYERWCTENGVVSSFVRFHPLYANHRHADGALRTERLGPTVAWNLERDLFGAMHRHHRRAVRKAEAAGAEVRITSAPPSLERFGALYDETMSRLGAGSFYFFPAEYWERLLALDERLLVLEALADGELAASLLCLAAPPWLHYHLGATSERGRQTGATNLLMLRAAEWAKEHGFRLFHLGGGVGAGEDSLFTYKERFAPGETREAWIGKGVHDPVRYRELVGADEVSFDGFFPAYRSRD